MPRKQEPTEPAPGTRPERVARYRRGRWSEWLAAGYLIAKGYRILAWRVRLPAGEIDLIALRGRRLAFVEVKYRPTLAEARNAVAPGQQQRLRRAAETWVARHSRYRDHDIGLDALFITPWSLPRHEMDVFHGR